MATNQNLGYYTYWEQPAVLAVELKAEDGTVMNITGFSVECDWKIKGQTPADTANRFTGSVSDGPAGLVSVPWGTQTPSPFADPVAVAPYTVELDVWAGDGTVRTASQRFRFAILPSLSTVEPTV